MQIGPNVSIGAGSVIGAGVRIRDSIILPGVTIQVCAVLSLSAGRLFEYNRTGCAAASITMKASCFVLNSLYYVRTCHHCPSSAGSYLHSQHDRWVELVDWPVGSH